MHFPPYRFIPVSLPEWRDSWLSLVPMADYLMAVRPGIVRVYRGIWRGHTVNEKEVMPKRASARKNVPEFSSS